MFLRLMQKRRSIIRTTQNAPKYRLSEGIFFWGHSALAKPHPSEEGRPLPLPSGQSTFDYCPPATPMYVDNVFVTWSVGDVL